MTPSPSAPEPDLWSLLQLLRRSLGLLVLSALLGCLLALGAAKLLVTPQYESSATLYVQQTQSGKDLADSFEVIVKMRESLLDVIEYTGMGYNHLQLQKQITVTSVNETDFFQVTVRAETPQEAALIANTIGQTLPRQIAEIMEGTTVKTVGEAVPAQRPSTPNYPNTALLGTAIGLLAALLLIFAREWLPKLRKHPSQD